MSATTNQQGLHFRSTTHQQNGNSPKMQATFRDDYHVKSSNHHIHANYNHSASCADFRSPAKASSHNNSINLTPNENSSCYDHNSRATNESASFSVLSYIQDGATALINSALNYPANQRKLSTDNFSTRSNNSSKISQQPWKY